MAKERNNKKFDFSKTNEKRFDFTKDKLDDVEVPQRPQVDSVTVPLTLKTEKKLNIGKIVGGIVAIVAILVGTYFFGFNDVANIGADNVGTTTELVNQVGESSEPKSPKTTTVVDEDDTCEKIATLTDCNKVVESTKVEEKIVDESSKKEVATLQPAKPSPTKQTNTSTIASTSALVGGDVENIARRVIRGDFGNGEERKHKLGSEYSVIQKKVNEMYANGLVY